MDTDSADFRHSWEDLAVPSYHTWPPPGQPLTPRPRLFGRSGVRPLSGAPQRSVQPEGLPMIGKLLGHTQVQTTARYAHLARDTVKASAARIGDSIDGDLDITE